MRRGHRIARRLEFGGCQKRFKLGDPGFPALRDAFAFSSSSDTEGVLETAPANVARENALFIGECPPVRGLDLLDCADRGKIVLVFLRLGSLAQSQSIVDDEIERRNIDRRSVLDVNAWGVPEQRGFVFRLFVYVSGGRRIVSRSTTSSASCF